MTYLAQVKHLASYKSRACEVDAWTMLYGRLRRIQPTTEPVRKARATWSVDGYAPKTINNRVQTLGHLYRTLDGDGAATPADGVKKIAVPPSPKVLVNAKVFRTVAANDYAKALYVAGWPKNVRPYQARHSMALELGERGIDLADVSAVLGHRDIITTRKHYAPILSSRLKQASEILAGRFDDWKRPEPECDSPIVSGLPSAAGIH